MIKPTFYTAFSNSIDDKHVHPDLTEEAMKITGNAIGGLIEKLSNIKL